MRKAAAERLRAFSEDQSGYLLFMALFVMVIMLIVGIALIVVGTSEATISKRYTVMGEAYSIAEAGVQRATIAVASNDQSTDGSFKGLAENTTVSTTTPQWKTTESFTVGGRPGKYTAEVYQNPDYPDQPSYKIIRSTGEYTYGTTKIMRKVEASLSIPVQGKDYDAAFDYVMYNGNNSGSTSTWPENFDTGDPTKWYLGNFTWDGGTTESGGHTPKGAVYMNGNVMVPAAVSPHLKFKGPGPGLGAAIVATGNVEFKNNWQANIVPGTVIDGDLVAGLGHKLPLSPDWGNVTISSGGTLSVKNLVQVTGNIVANGNVKATCSWLAGWDPTFSIGGIYAAGNVEIGGTAQLGGGVTIGSIVSAGKTFLTSVAATSGITVTSIRAGNDSGPTNVETIDYYNCGVVLDTDWGSINSGLITSNGRVVIYADAAKVTTGNIWAGNDTSSDNGGNGLYADVEWFSGLTTANISSAGAVRLYSPRHLGGVDYTQFNIGDIITPYGVGATIDIQQGGLVNGGNIYVGGLFNCQIRGFADEELCFLTLGQISGMQGVIINQPDPILVGGIKAGNASIPADISVYCSNRTYSGEESYITGPIQASRDITIKHENWRWLGGGDLFLNANGVKEGIYWATAHNKVKVIADYDSIFNQPDIDLGGMQAPQVEVWSVNLLGNLVSNYNSDQVGGTRSQTMPSPEYPQQSPQTVNKPGVPTVGDTWHDGKDINTYSAANLEKPVAVLKPSWDHFKQKAEDDDAEVRAQSDPYDPVVPADRMHILPSGADYHLFWRADKYSSHETVYMEDQEHTLYIDGATFLGDTQEYEATIVARGNVTIDVKNAGDWVWGGAKQTLTIISGGSITWINNPGAVGLFSSRVNSTLYLYALNDIILEDLKWTAWESPWGGSVPDPGSNYYGSFTAGNRVYFSSPYTLVNNTTFHWKRWALDPVGWAPSYKVLSWKEL